MRLLIVAAAVALGPACSRDAGTPSAEQNRHMEEAADLLDEAPDRLANIDDSELLGNREQAADAARNK